MKKDNARSVSFAVLEPDSYLVVTADEALLLDYCVQMNERNQIPGLLEPHLQSFNGELELHYNITGKRRLTDLVTREKLDRQQGEHIFRSLIHGFHQMPEYFLRPGMCLLELEFLFVDEHLNTYLPLLPLSTAPEQSSGELREFFLSMMGECFVGDRPEPYFDRILKYLIRPDFSLEKLEELAVPKAAAPVVSAPAPAAPVYPAPPSAAPAAPRSAQPVYQAPPAVHAAPRNVKAATPPGVNFAIPGGGMVPSAPEKKTKKDKAPKAARQEQGRKLFGFGRGGGKKSPEVQAPPRLDMGKETHILSEAPRPTFVPPPIPSDEGEWEGTVNFEDDERTVFLSSAASIEPVLIHQGRRVQISAFPFTIGKTDCSYNVPNPKVSRRHATILCQGGSYFIQDESSTNHTYVDGVALPPYTPYPLTSGAVIRLANEEFTFEAGGNA